MNIPRISLKRALVLVIFTELTVCLGLVAGALLNKPARHASEPPALQAAVSHERATVEVIRSMPNAGLPARLKIPKLNVDAVIEQVGLTLRGDLAAPRAPANAAWYNRGPRPGDTGNAIIDGHFGYRDRIPAVFDNLATLLPGDILHVEDERGVIITFVVRELRTYAPHEDASNVLVPKDGKAHLNLITCQGAWSATKKSYARRLVVFTDRLVE